MAKKTSSQLDLEIKEALAKSAVTERSYRLGTRAANDEIARTNFAFHQITDESAKIRLDDDKVRFGAGSIDAAAWRAGWTQTLSTERREHDVLRPSDPYLPLVDLGFLFRK